MLTILLTKLFEAELININSFLELVLRFGLNTLILLIIVRYIYYPIAKRKDYLFTYILIGTSIFLLCQVMGNVKLQLGMALGLFAVFGIIRYRTNAMPIKEMTYLFIIIAIAVINALSNKKVSWVELLFTNLALTAIIYGLERIWLLRHESCKSIIYEKIDLIVPEKREELLADLKLRTGIVATRIEIIRVDFMRDIARLNIYYFEDKYVIPSADTRESANSDNDE